MKLDSSTNGKQRIVTEKDIKAPWRGGENGKYFRCAFCGYKFKLGDKWRFQYTNDMKEAPGNPLVCECCDEGPEKTREKWKAKTAEFKSEKWWWFLV